jgi:L-asparaginase II
MSLPILIEVTRGGRVESRHHGSVVVVDAKGARALALGEVEAAVFPRSAVKALQALPLIESGAADKYGLDAAEIALACSSHSGEPIHAQTAAAMLGKARREPGCLECGAHWPLGEQAARQLAREGKTPSALHNNCSGKHAGFVCLSCALGEDPTGYVGVDHRVQRETRRAIEEMTETPIDVAQAGVDGCSIPTYPSPLHKLAQAFARLGTGEGLSRARAQAAERLRKACARHPHMVAGTGRFDTAIMNALGERCFVKTGAEGVHCASFPELGLGVAIKCDDGAGRAADAIMGAVIQRFLPLSDAEREAVAPRVVSVMKNWNGIEVGVVRPAAALLG